MKSKKRETLTSIIIFFVIIAIIATAIVLGLIFLQEFLKEEDTVAEDFKYNATNQESKAQEEMETPEIVENPINEIDSTEVKNVDYSNVNVDKFFYNQLNDYSKTIYKAFESNKENMKTGTYKIELGTSFSSLLSQSNGQDLLGDYYQSAIEAYTYDNPDVFYLSPNKMFLNMETTTQGKKVTYNVYINSGSEANYLVDGYNSKQDIDNAMSQIEQVKNEILSRRTGNTYNDIKLVHDYLVDNVEYDSSISKPNIYDIYGALVRKESVCEGYARSFKYLMDELNIPCTLVIGTATNSQGQTENHAWNYVQINNNWYAVDTTWDDPIIIGNGTVSESIKYRYFLKGSSEINKDHFPSGKFTENGMEFSYPNLSSNNYE